MNSSRPACSHPALRLASICTALVSLILLAIWPLLRAGYPTIGDGLNHLYRLVEFEHLLHHGAWYPRWATDLGYGYGYPLFNFYPPLVYYLGALPSALGLPHAAALSSIYVLAIAAAISGTYVLARQRLDVAGSLIAAAACGLSPYIYFNVFARGALPETLGLGFLPWTLWAYHRLTRKAAGGRLLLATLLYAATWLSHLLSALLAFPLILLFVAIAAPPARLLSLIWRAVRLILSHADRPVPYRRLWRLLRRLLSPYVPPLISLALAGLISSFFILPAYIETSAVQIHQLTLPGDLDFHNHFLSLAGLFALPRTFDPRLVFVAVPPSLSLAAVALAIAGVLPLLRQIAYRPRPLSRISPFRHSSLFWNWDFLIAAALIALCAFTLPFSIGIWEKFRPAAIIQFPWRLIGPASILLALLAGGICRPTDISRTAAVTRCSSPLRRLWLLPAALCALWLYSLTWSFGAYLPAPANPGVRDLAAYEAASGQLGTTSAAEFLPRTVQQMPPADSLAGRYAQKEVIDRLAALPPQVTLISQSATVASATAVVVASIPVTLTFDVFNFPGWQAAVDGRPVPLSASEPHGLITVPIPDGRHTVSIHFGSTFTRDLGAVLSLLACLLLIFHVLRLRILPSARAVTGVSASQTQSAEPSVLACMLFGLASVLLLTLRLALIDGRATIFCRSRFDGATVTGAGQPLDVNFANQLVLIGSDRPPSPIAADEIIPITLYWRAQNLPAHDYSTTIQVFDAAGNLVGQSDSQHPGRLPTSRWRPDQYARDEHRLELFPGTPPGTYRLAAAVYRPDGPALDILDENQIPQGQYFTLGHLTVGRARRPPTDLGAAHKSDFSLGPLGLVGWTLNDLEPQAGDEMRLTLFWRAATATRPDLSARLALVTAAGEEVTAWNATLGGADYPPSAWAAGEIVRSPLRLRLPADISAGPAALQIALTAPADATVAGPITLTEIDLRVPPRSFSIPPVAHPRSDVFCGSVKLLGYDHTNDSLTLYWQALAPMSISYTVFVHVLASDGHILAQADSLPLGGKRPTTGWLPGEVLTDTYALPLNGAGQVEVGLYDAAGATRLGTAILEYGE